MNTQPPKKGSRTKQQLVTATTATLMALSLGMSTATGVVQAATVDTTSDSKHKADAPKLPVTGNALKTDPSQEALDEAGKSKEVKPTKDEPKEQPQEKTKDVPKDEVKKPDPNKKMDVTFGFRTFGNVNEELAPDWTAKDLVVGTKFKVKDVIRGHLPAIPGYTLMTSMEDQHTVREGMKIIPIFYMKGGNHPGEIPEIPEPGKADITFKFGPDRLHVDPVTIKKQVVGSKYTPRSLLKDRIPYVPGYHIPDWDLDTKETVGEAGSGGNTILLVYVKGEDPNPVKRDVTFKFIDQDGKSISDDYVWKEQIVGTSFVYEDALKDHLPKIDGYDLKESLDQKWMVKSEDNTINIHYEKRAPQYADVTVLFINRETGEEIALEKQIPHVLLGTYHYSDLITNEISRVLGYELVTSLDEEVMVNEFGGNIYLEYVEKEPEIPMLPELPKPPETTSVTAKFIDKATKKEVASSVDILKAVFGPQPIKDLIGDQLPTVKDYDLVTDLN